MAAPAEPGSERRAEIYTYEAPHNVFAMNWSVSLSPCWHSLALTRQAHTL